MASIFREAVTRELEDQPTLLRYKGSILIVATGVVGIISQLAVSPDLQGTGWATVLTVAATVLTFLLNRFTRDGVTPSQASRLEQSAQRVFDTVPFETQPMPPSAATTAPAATAETTEEYVGAHRADDDGLFDGAAARQVVEREHQQATTQGA